MEINGNIDLSKILTLGDLAPLSCRIKELELLFSRLADINKQLIEQQLQIVGPTKLTKDAYKVSEVSKLTGLSKSVIRQKVYAGEILKMSSSTAGLILIPRTEVERLTIIQNTITEKENEERNILTSISKNEISGITISKRKLKKLHI